ncbi:MAG: Eukaryotic peptide chain release factor GTP-binding subunit [Pleopsidium flavum]|nr:MAG: Eukaryotic peptide chain release factor GTP-binding subunit [Pleopsidium flavum]
MTSQTNSALHDSPVSSSLQISANAVPESHNAPSVISSRMTDIASEDGDGDVAESTTPKGIPNAGLSFGEPVANMSRPISSATGISSQRGTSSQPPPSRRGVPPTGVVGGLGDGVQSGWMGGSNSETNGPQGLSSRTSRTHVPSLTSHAFFHPMSSQRLQAQRGMRPNTMRHSVPSEDGYSETASNANRQSVGSMPTQRQGPLIHQDPEVPPPSRGTEFTEQDGIDRATANTSPTGHGTVQSMSESVRPLQSRSSNPRPTHLDLHKNYKQGLGMLSPPSKSPRSFRSSFLLPAKGDVQPNNDTQGRERLSSGASSPRFQQTKAAQEVKQELGRNHQYFAGNTVFCLGGRLQNARDRPMNIATGIFVLLPGVLFFIYSAPWLWHNVSPAIPILFAYIFFICISSFIHASVTDPGILPRNLHPMPQPDNTEDPLTLGPRLDDWVLIKSSRPSGAAIEVPIKRNYRYFFTFASTGTIMSLFLIGASLAHCLKYMAMEGVSFREAINEWRVPLAMALYGVLALPYPSTLFAYHLYLTGRGETTREFLNSHNFPKKDRHRPFSQGSFIKNWVAVLLRPRPPTYLHFMRKYEEGDQRFGARRGQTQAPLVAAQQGGGIEMQNVSGANPKFEGPNTRTAGEPEEGHRK